MSVNIEGSPTTAARLVKRRFFNATIRDRNLRDLGCCWISSRDRAQRETPRAMALGVFRFPDWRI